MKIKTLIIEDEDNARQALKNMLGFYCTELVLSAEATTVAEAKKILGSKPFELVFMDIHLPDGTAFDILKGQDMSAFKLIFVTAYDEFALQAIKLSALDYILKPVNPAELIKAVKKAQKAIESEEIMNLQLDACADNINSKPADKKIILNAGSKMHFLNVQQIIRAEAQENFCQVSTSENQKILISRSMKELEEILVPSGFFRVHHSHLINLRQIESFDKSEGMLKLRNSDSVPVSTRRRESFLKALDLIF